MFYNCHIHIFRDIDIPNRFLPLALVKLLRTKVGFHFIATSLKRIVPFTDKDMFDRYVRFATLGKLGSQQKIFEACRKFYPSDTEFFVLTMDMAFMNAGKAPRDFPEQLEELADLKRIYPQLLPFIHIDPRRKEIYSLFRKCIDEWDFKGIKLYPPLGYFPYDEGLDDIYAYCQEKNLPVVAHCSPFNPVRNKGSKKEIKKLLENSRKEIETHKVKKKVLCSYFTDPRNYIYVIEKFPKLKICFAHFGSSYAWNKYLTDPDEKENWFNIIREMIKKYDNFYTDVSFTMNDKNLFPLLKVMLADPILNKKVLFGSDYYMVATESDERRFGIEFRAFIGEENFKKIAYENPRRFLRIVSK